MKKTARMVMVAGLVLAFPLGLNAQSTESPEEGRMYEQAPEEKGRSQMWPDQREEQSVEEQQALEEQESSPRARMEDEELAPGQEDEELYIEEDQELELGPDDAIVTEEEQYETIIE